MIMYPFLDQLFLFNKGCLLVRLVSSVLTIPWLESLLIYFNPSIITKYLETTKLTKRKTHSSADIQTIGSLQSYLLFKNLHSLIYQYKSWPLLINSYYPCASSIGFDFDSHRHLGPRRSQYHQWSQRY